MPTLSERLARTGEAAVLRVAVAAAISAALRGAGAMLETGERMTEAATDPALSGHLRALVKGIAAELLAAGARIEMDRRRAERET